MKDVLFRNRIEAGRILASRLSGYAHRPDVLVLGLPRGGIPVAFHVAKALRAPLDVLVVRKLGMPDEPELAMGAIASGGVRVLNDDVVRAYGIAPQTIDRVAAYEAVELARRERLYRGDAPLPDVRGRIVILVDDGIATGSTMRAAIKVLRQQQVGRIVVAVPVAAATTCAELRPLVDDLVCVLTPKFLLGIGQWYDDFSQTSDDEVRRLLEQARQESDPSGDAPMKRSASYSGEKLVQVVAGNVTLEGMLFIPEDARGIVLFAHGSGSSRHSPRNQQVARVLQQAGLATLLVDLLTAEEEAVDIHTAHLRFDIALLADRLVGATDWLIRTPETRRLKIGYFGASTGAAAALVAAATRPYNVAAVVSRGGRPDLAGPSLPHVQAPTLLIVGANDRIVIGMNETAMAHLVAVKRLEIVPRATHLFEEPGTLDQVARLAREWFLRYLVAGELRGTPESQIQSESAPSEQ